MGVTVGLFFTLLVGGPLEERLNGSLNKPLVPPASVQARMLLDGDGDPRILAGAGEKACPWLNWALLQTKDGTKGRGNVLNAITQIGPDAKACLPCLYLMRNERNRRMFDHVIKVVENKR
jgi:hypothetical protein